MTVTLIIVTTMGMFMAQTMVFHSFPEAMKAILSCVPVAGVATNFFLSWCILFFTGTASMVGISNLIASIMFGFYLITYKAMNGIDLSVEWRGKGLFRYPALLITQGAPS